MITFPNKFDNAQADTRILDKLTTESEISGLLNLALAGLKRLMNTHHYSREPSPDEIAERYQKASDSIFAFVDDICESSPTHWISKANLYEAFVKYCDAQNLSRLGKEAFGRKLKDASNVHVKSRQRRVDGVITWGWEGIQVIKKQEQEQDIDMEV